MTSHYNIKCCSFYSTAVLLCFFMISEHIGVFVLPWHKFKNSVVIEIGLLHMELFINSHFSFLSSVEPVTS